MKTIIKKRQAICAIQRRLGLYLSQVYFNKDSYMKIKEMFETKSTVMSLRYFLSSPRRWRPYTTLDALQISNRPYHAYGHGKAKDRTVEIASKIRTNTVSKAWLT